MNERLEETSIDKSYSYICWDYFLINKIDHFSVSPAPFLLLSRNFPRYACIITSPEKVRYFGTCTN